MTRLIIGSWEYITRPVHHKSRHLVCVEEHCDAKPEARHSTESCRENASKSSTCSRRKVNGRPKSRPAQKNHPWSVMHHRRRPRNQQALSPHQRKRRPPKKPNAPRKRSPRLSMKRLATTKKTRMTISPPRSARPPGEDTRTPTRVGSRSPKPTKEMFHGTRERIDPRLPKPRLLPESGRAIEKYCSENWHNST